MIRARSLWTACLLLPALCYPSRAATVYVNKNAPGTAHDGGSWVTAFTTVQQGIDAAVAGDEIWVAAGSYVENVTIRSGKSLYGGFAGIETEKSQRHPAINVTILSGAGKGRVVTIIAGTGSSQSVTADGFTIRSGSIAGGGGGCIVNGDATISNNIITGNAAITSGTGWGGAIGTSNGTMTIANCLIVGNTSDQGSAVYTSGGHVTVLNSTLSENRCQDYGAVYCRGAGSVTMVNTILANNDSGIYLNSGSVTFRNCDVYGNTAYNFSGPADPTGTNGNISQDPKLSAYSTGSHLPPGSPCIDVGNDSVVTPGATDLYGKPRIIGAHVDIGADESDGTPYPNPPARIWRVVPAGDDANDGTTWGKAKASVGMTLLLAQAGDEVWVAAGTYPCVGSLRSGVGLYGGFAGTETSRTQRNPLANATILDGTVYKTSTAKFGWRVITIAQDATSDNVVDGFTIQNGDGVNGSGIYIAGGSPIISNNSLTSNGRSALVYLTTIVINGGGIYVSGGSPTISGNTLTSNGATYGGAIYVADGMPVISHNVITGNHIYYAAGGIFASGGTPLVANNSINLNGGAASMRAVASSGTIRLPRT